MEFQFEQSPWEAYLNACRPGASVSAWELISMLEGEDDEAVEDAFSVLAEKNLSLDLSSLPNMEIGSKTALRLKQEAEYVRSGLKCAELVQNDPLRLYLEEISADAPEEEENLLPKLLAGDEDAAQRLLHLGLSRVVALASEQAGKMVLLLDLIQEGNIGLWEAIQSYSGGDYAAYRDKRIRSALARAMVLQARSSGVSRKMRLALQAYKSADEALLTELGRNPSLEEIAEKIHVTPDQAQTIQKALSNILLLQQAEKQSQPRKETQEDALPVEDTAYFQMRQRIWELLSQLDEQDAKILTMRFGLDRGLPMSVDEVSKALGLTAGEISDREAAALAKLRTE